MIIENGSRAIAAISKISPNEELNFLPGYEEDNSISLYFKEIGRFDMLTREEEVVLAKKIDAGRHANFRITDTSVRLTKEERGELEAIANDGVLAKNIFIVSNTRLVIAVAKRYIGQGVPFLDLIQEGNLGLERAVEKFNYRKGFRFSTYGLWWIQQGIDRAIAKQKRTIVVSVHMNEQIKRVGIIAKLLEQTLRREPTKQEIADELGIPASKVALALKSDRRPVSLHKLVGPMHDSELGDYIKSEDPTGGPEAVAIQSDLTEAINNNMNCLTFREQCVLELSYGLNGKTIQSQNEIGKLFNVTGSRIQQIKHDALEKLRRPERAARLRDFYE